MRVLPRVLGTLLVSLLLAALPLAGGATGDEAEWADIQGIAEGDHWTFEVTGKEEGEIRNKVVGVENKRNAWGQTHESYRIDVEGELTSEQRARKLSVTDQGQRVNMRIEGAKWVRVTDYAAVHLEGKTWVEGRLDLDVKEAYDPPLVETVFPFTSEYSWRSGAHHYIKKSGDEAEQTELEITVTVLGQERITVPAGTFDTWKINITGGKDKDRYKWQWYAETACDLVQEELYENQGEFVSRLRLTEHKCTREAKQNPTYDPDWVTLVTTGGKTPPRPDGFDNYRPPAVTQESPGNTMVWVLVSGAVVAAAGAALLRRRVF